MSLLEDRIRGGIWGVLVADALGVPHQFKSAAEIPGPADISMQMSPTYPKTYPRVAYGTWSDDGALTLALTDSLARNRGLDIDDFGRSLVGWFTKGEYTPDQKAYDIGGTTTEAILRIVRGTPAADAGLTTENANGNGSLMRTLPLALWHRGSDEALYADACRVSAVTHGHDFSKAACGVYSVAARHILNGESVTHAWIKGLKCSHLKLPIPHTPTGSGFVLDTLSLAIEATRSWESYRICVLQAIRLGADTDTTAAVVGGLIGARDGIEAIPIEWLSQLRAGPLAEKYVDAFVQARLNSPLV